MKIVKLMLLFAAVSTSLVASAQSVDDVIAKHIDAMGGKDKIAAVKSITTTSTIQVMGADNPASTVMLNGVGYKSEAEINGSKIVQCINAKGGWTINPFTGGSGPEAMPDNQYQSGKSQMYAGGALMDYASKGYKAELLGKDGNNYKIKLTSAGNVESTYYIDATTYLVAKTVSKSEMQGQPVEVTTTLSDYRKNDAGLMSPYKIDIDLGQFQLAYVIKTIEVNKDVDPKIFDMPAK
ncbi:MAG TPA: hypothetical protein VGN20_27240 [Mucilaginibacter sp.]|jgi:hypothetical protein